ncbi:unnamed protein product [Oppiella nova]|uniref:NADP-dependent oxidoreductase domain-containing protein n=1 Tax=Oppiella nova TaxID=334625 RepID=A0A7R9MBI0_9ACAR|nr:unnamed protein product [Oppiella nova]CAG2174347.1 unnamed protein product [Oppiella nova]
MYFSSIILLCISVVIKTNAKSLNLSNFSSSVPDDYITLNNGIKMPILGMGTGSKEFTRDLVYKTVKNGIDAGFRHIDSAYFYGSEPEVGSAIIEKIAEGKIKREDVFVTTKIWNTFHSSARASEAIQMSFTNLNIKYIDLLLMNWPMGYQEGPDMEPMDPYHHIIPSPIDYIDTWKEMEAAVRDGRVKSIGVSNFNSKQITRLLEFATIKPVINQIESHPTLTQKLLIDFCHQKGINVTAYSPLGEGKLMEKPDLVKIGSSHGKSTAQVMIRYQIQRGVAVIPRSLNKQHLVENFNVFDFTLTPAEMTTIDNMNRNVRYYLEQAAEKHEYYPFSDPY